MISLREAFKTNETVLLGENSKPGRGSSPFSEISQGNFRRGCEGFRLTNEKFPNLKLGDVYKTSLVLILKKLLTTGEK